MFDRVVIRKLTKAWDRGGNADPVTDESVEKIKELLKNSGMLENTPMAIYAALDDVRVAKGENRALEVAREIRHLELAGGMNLNRAIATLHLIYEALKPETDEYPFSWFAQFSEHSWVFTS